MYEYIYTLQIQIKLPSTTLFNTQEIYPNHRLIHKDINESVIRPKDINESLCDSAKRNQ